jgi:3-oxoacyl-[acyl-carrier-protein] synthase-1
MAGADRVVVVGVGMLTAVGLSAPETAASVRTATMRFAETSIRDHRFEPFTLAEVPEEGLSPLVESVASTTGLTSREMRILRLAPAALLECLVPLRDIPDRPGLVLALPETSTTSPIESDSLLRLLERQTGGAFDVSRSDASAVGRAGGLVAIQRAADEIRAHRARFMVAGGVDSYRDLYVLGTMDMEKRVKSSAHLDGFIPGEGAAFLLLTSEANASRSGLTPLARLSSLALGFEGGHLYSEAPYRGDGLAGTIQTLTSTADADWPFREIYSSMNGENHWAKEWAVSFLRNRAAFDDDHGMQHPADCFGDTGAACGPLMVGLAALGMVGGYRQSPALVYGSSDFGARAALSVSSIG